MATFCANLVIRCTDKRMYGEHIRLEVTDIGKARAIIKGKMADIFVRYWRGRVEDVRVEGNKILEEHYYE